MNKHTPGDYKVIDGPMGALQSRSGRKSAPGGTVYVENDDGSVTVVAAFTYTLENARLFAAAPDLLEALEKIAVLQCLNTIRPCDGKNVTCATCIAREAIANAKG